MGENTMKKVLSLMLALVLCAGLTVPVMAGEASLPDVPAFTDVPPEHYAAEAIDWCVSRGVMIGYTDETFKPAASLTRAQFCVMLARVFFPEELRNFEAQGAGQPWYWASLMALARKGILAGTWWSTDDTWRGADDSWRRTEDIWWRGEDSGNFRVEMSMSRYEMALLLYNIMTRNFMSVSLSQQDAASQRIPDWDQVPDRYTISVSSVYAAGIVTGHTDGSFCGSDLVNRAQAAAVVYRLVRYLGVPMEPIYNVNA